ncbi:MAG: hypothetical protein AAFV25_05140, partial [Bacteroidota bacterium]
LGVNGLVGGIGALVNKKDGEKAGKVFWKGFGQGCLGGAFQIAGKAFTYQINDKKNLSYGWAARITNAIGSSIAQNAANNINFWERWHFNFGLFRFDYHVKEKKFQARLFPSAFYGTFVAARQAKFSLKETLKTGVMVYRKKGNVSAWGLNANGLAFVSSIVYDETLSRDEYHSLMAHEVVHILQYDNMVWLNPFFNRWDQKLKNNIKAYKNLSEYVYFDFNGLTILSLYRMQLNKDWDCRFIERQANHYSRRVPMPRCND